MKTVDIEQFHIDNKLFMEKCERIWFHQGEINKILDTMPKTSLIYRESERIKFIRDE